MYKSFLYIFQCKFVLLFSKLRSFFFFLFLNSLFHLLHPAVFPQGMFDRKWNESEPLLGSPVLMPAQAEQRKLIGLSSNHREKSSLKVSLGTKRVGLLFFCCSPWKKKKKDRKKAGQMHQKEEIKHG